MKALFYYIRCHEWKYRFIIVYIRQALHLKDIKAQSKIQITKKCLDFE
jgi:hypothetical protein